MKCRVKVVKQEVKYDYVPHAIKELPKWCVWKLEQGNGNTTKPPYNARTGRRGSPTNQLTWCSFQEAVSALESGQYKGIGFVFTASDTIAGIDIDDCRNPETGEIASWAQEIINAHSTYWEVSPSETGVKGYLKANISIKGVAKSYKTGKIEIYTKDRYFTVTGNRVISTPCEVTDCTEAFRELHKTLTLNSKDNAVMQGWIERKRDHITDDEILRRLFNERERGSEWEALYNNGEWSKVTSSSEADAALLSKLAYYAGSDGHSQIERLAYNSALCRDKWDSKRNGTTWLKEEIIKACSGITKSTGLSVITSNSLTPLNILDYVVGLDTVEVKPISWLWEGWLPAGKLSLLSGDPGLGKTTVALDIAARLSTAELMPNSQKKTLLGETLILTAEDDLADTIKPRIIAADGNPLKIKALPSVPTTDRGQTFTRMPSLPDDISSLKKIIEQYDIKLVIVDPLMAFLGSDIDSHRDQDIRRAFGELKAVAESTGAAILLIRHLNKSNAGKAVYRGGGSIGITGAVRSEILCVEDPNDKNGRILVLAKSNLSAIKNGLKFHLESRAGDTVARIVWDGVTDLSADELLTQGNNRDTAVDRAGEFLKSTLVEGKRLSTEIMTEAQEAGISREAIKRAKKLLEIKPSRINNAWYMALPNPVEDSNKRSNLSMKEGATPMTKVTVFKSKTRTT